MSTPNTIPMPDTPGVIVHGSTVITAEITLSGQAFRYRFDDTIGAVTLEVQRPGGHPRDGRLAKMNLGCGHHVDSAHNAFQAADLTVEDAQTAAVAVAHFYHEERYTPSRKALRTLYRVLTQPNIGIPMSRASSGRCTCVFHCAYCAYYGSASCSLSGEWHVHPGPDRFGIGGPCPTHPDARLDESLVA